MAEKGNPITIYSNIVQVRITPVELVLEFGTFFPESVPPPTVGPKDFVAEARVVMHINALEQLTNALMTASKARADASKTQQIAPSAKAQ